MNKDNKHNNTEGLGDNPARPGAAGVRGRVIIILVIMIILIMIIMIIVIMIMIMIVIILLSYY